MLTENPYATGDKLAVSGEVNRMIAAAINADPHCFWHGPNARFQECCGEEISQFEPVIGRARHWGSVASEKETCSGVTRSLLYVDNAALGW
jgi:hypothetical protein